MTRRLTIRGRAALTAALVVGTTLLMGAVLMLWLLRSNLADNLDSTLEQQARDTAAFLDGGADPQVLVTGQTDEAFVWIGLESGQQIAVGGSLVPQELPPGLVGGQTRTVELRVEEDYIGSPTAEVEVEELRISSASAADGRLVMVGAELEGVDDPVAAVRNVLAVGLPILVVLAAAVAWLNTTQALRPVERIRSRAAGISGSTLSDRVPVPDARDEIHDLAETMNSMLDRLEVHSASMRQFTADASHELKSPVANIRAIIDTADLSERPDLVRKRLGHETDRLGNLVENLLYLAAADEGRAPVAQVGSVDLDDLIFDEAEILASSATARVDVSGVAPVTVQADREMIRRVIRNLGENARRYASSTIWIGVAEDGDGAVLTVADDGPGIPDDDHERVFERFTRLDEARDRGAGGTGLGLSIVRSIAEVHGGSATVSTRDGGGAEFRVTLAGPAH